MNAYDKTLRFWRDKHITTDAQLAAVLSGHSVTFAYHSTKLEHPAVSRHDVREIFDHDGVTDYTGDLVTLLMLRNARTASELFLAAFGEGRALDEELICAFQEALTTGTYDNKKLSVGERPGTYKVHDYVTGKYDVGAAPEDVQEEIAELLGELEGIEDKNILKAAAYFHAKFENIHAFAAGNGRTGRLAMNYFLVRRDHPPVTFHEEDRGAYFRALEAWDRDQSLDPLCDFLKEQTVKTWERRVS